MSAAEPHAQPHAPIYPPDEALRKARPVPPREDLVDEDLSEEEWERFQEALAEA